jgi:hypothetical protein
MKTINVNIGDEYSVKVSGHLARVRIDAASEYGGWNGTNVATGRAVRIKSARRLRANLSAIIRAGGAAKLALSRDPILGAAVVAEPRQRPRYDDPTATTEAHQPDAQARGGQK